MKAPTLLLVAALLTTSAAAAEIKSLGFRPGGIAPQGPYDLRVSFGSYCCGIDRAGLEQVRALIRESPLPTVAEEWGWGREGEREIGLRFAKTEDREAFAARLAQLRQERATALAASGKAKTTPPFAVLRGGGGKAVHLGQRKS